jgi:catechol 2,3-dioxygenase-like lactoylglutathione lyase family enzyme
MNMTGADNRPTAARRTISQIALVVRDYDEAIYFYVDVLGFTLIEDTVIPAQGKRWVVVAPRGSTGSRLLLARAANDEQASRIGNQTGGRVFLFLHTDDIWRDFHAYKAKGVIFVREPKVESYGTLAVFEDIYGNLWDLLQANADVLPDGRDA